MCELEGLLKAPVQTLQSIYIWGEDAQTSECENGPEHSCLHCAFHLTYGDPAARIFRSAAPITIKMS